MSSVLLAPTAPGRSFFPFRAGWPKKFLTFGPVYAIMGAPEREGRGTSKRRRLMLALGRETVAEDSKGYVQKLQTSSVYGNIKPREPGYYWVKWSDCEPSIERWDGGHWLAPGSEEWSRDNDGVQVLSERLTPPQQMQTVRVIAEDYSVQRDGGEIIDYGEKGVELGRRPAGSVVAAPVEKIDALLKEAQKMINTTSVKREEADPKRSGFKGLTCSQCDQPAKVRNHGELFCGLHDPFANPER